MKKVLIIANLCHVSPRVRGLARYLPEFGWEPIIVTPYCSQAAGSQLRIIETPCRDALAPVKRLFGLNAGESDIRKRVKERFRVNSKKSLLDYALTAGGAIFNYPDGEKGWKPFAVSECSKIIQSEDISAIISNSAPITSHIIAKELKAKYGIPWVADFRDPWSQNHNYSYGPIRQLIDRRLERKTLSKADALVIVSKLWANKLEALHRGKAVYTITNSFDPYEVNNPPAELTAKFTITYSGSVWPQKQHPWKFLAAIRDLVSDRTIDPNDIKIRFYGPKENWLEREIEQYGLSSIVKQFGIIPRQVVLEKQRESHILLLIAWEDSQKQGAYGGKTFEYLAARRPILVTGYPSNVIKELLNETGAGIWASNTEIIKNSLIEMYQEYKGKSAVTYKGKKSIIDKYSHREGAKKISQILDPLYLKWQAHHR